MNARELWGGGGGGGAGERVNQWMDLFLLRTDCSPLKKKLSH